MDLELQTPDVAFDGLSLVCPECQTPVFGGEENCSGCSRKLESRSHWMDLGFIEALDERRPHFSTPVARWAYRFVWGGNFGKQVQFFRELLKFGEDIVDVGTGDGKLTRLALYGSKVKKPHSLMAIDISAGMLEKARQKIPFSNVVLVRADVNHLPLKNQSVKTLSCFGGFNSFPSGAAAMRELFRVMKPGGVVRGSVLLMPESGWRKKLVCRWIKKGYQTEEITEAKFFDWIKAGAFLPTIMRRQGDAILFELKKPEFFV